MGWMLDGLERATGLQHVPHSDGEVFHTYSVYARGTEWLGGSYAFLDLTALGRQEDWEEPKGRADNVRGARPRLLLVTGEASDNSEGGDEVVDHPASERLGQELHRPRLVVRRGRPAARDRASGCTPSRRCGRVGRRSS